MLLAVSKDEYGNRDQLGTLTNGWIQFKQSVYKFALLSEMALFHFLRNTTLH